MVFRCVAVSLEGPSDEESLAGAIHLLVIVQPLKLAMLAVKSALLHAAQLQGEAWAQLLQPGHHPPGLLLLARIPLLLFLKDVAVVPAGRTPIRVTPRSIQVRQEAELSRPSLHAAVGPTGAEHAGQAGRSWLTPVWLSCIRRRDALASSGETTAQRQADVVTNPEDQCCTTKRNDAVQQRGSLHTPAPSQSLSL